MLVGRVPKPLRAVDFGRDFVDEIMVEVNKNIIPRNVKCHSVVIDFIPNWWYNIY